ETSCLFYLKEINDIDNYTIVSNYNVTKNSDVSNILPDLIIKSKKYYEDKLNKKENLLYLSSKEVYVTYFLDVQYIPYDHLPLAEDLHIHYEDRYIRECKWFSYDEIVKMDDTMFHKRLQITKIKKRIMSYYENNVFFNY